MHNSSSHQNYNDPNLPINLYPSPSSSYSGSSTSVIQQRGNVIVRRRRQFSGEFSSAPPPSSSQSCQKITFCNSPEEEDNPAAPPKSYIDLDTHSTLLISRYPYQTPQSASLDKPNDFNQKTDPPAEYQPDNPSSSLPNDNLALGGGASVNRRKKKVQIFSCSYCSKTFRHKSYYDYHLRTHTGERPHKCNLCDKAFFERSKLNRHLSSCHNVKTGYGDSQAVIALIDNQPVDLSTKCPTCKKLFSSISALQTHISTYHEGQRPFNCSICQKKFSGRTALVNHQKIKHPETNGGNKIINCPICGKGFPLKKYLDLHLKTTHKKEARKFKCLNCRKDFHSQKDLKRHQLMHSNVKSFTCHLCQTSFKRKDNLQRHLKLTHQLTPEQIINSSGNSLEDGEEEDDIIAIEPPAPPPPQIINRQVSVIKSTQEVIMSITRGQQLI